jgi:RNA polymerase sigma-70 factor (ECF subfamily)
MRIEARSPHSPAIDPTLRPDSTSSTPRPGGPAPPSVAQLFADFAPFVFRALRRLGVPDADADDAVQEVFVVVHKKLFEFEGRSTIRTWVYGIAVRVAANQRARTRTRREAPVDPMPEPIALATQHEALEEKEARNVLDRILDTLDDDKRTVFVLHEIEQLPMHEIVEVVGCPLQTAYSRLRAARSHVEAAIGRYRARGGA